MNVCETKFIVFQAHVYMVKRFAPQNTQRPGRVGSRVKNLDQIPSLLDAMSVIGSKLNNQCTLSNATFCRLRNQCGLDFKTTDLDVVSAAGYHGQDRRLSSTAGCKVYSALVDRRRRRTMTACSGSIRRSTPSGYCHAGHDACLTTTTPTTTPTWAGEASGQDRHADRRWSGSN